MSVFESFRVIRGTPEFFEPHLARILHACADREFDVEEEALQDAAALFQKDAMDGFARIYVTAGDGSPTTLGSPPRIFVLLECRTPPDPDETLEIGLHEESYRAPFGGLKTANYWFNIDALALARCKHFDEALLFNDRAELVSACMANVFLVLGDQLHTPSRSTGARGGVIRDWVMKRGPVRERRLRREDVLAADEILLTSSWIGVQSVATVEGRPLGPRSVGPRLAAALQRRRSETLDSVQPELPLR